MLVSQIEDFKVFVRVVATGNMSAAAREMGLSPAVISKRISSMEERLGVRLFQRTTRQVQLTEAGAGFHERVVAILASIEEAEAYLTHGRDKPRGVLRVTVPTSFSRRHIAPHIPAFMREYPDVTLELFASDSIVDIIAEGYDAAIRISEIADSSLIVRQLAPCRRYLCAAPSYLEKHGIPANFEDLNPKHCYAMGANTVWRLSGPDGPVTLRVQGNLRTNSSEVVRESIVAGLGIALRSTWDVYEYLRAGTLKIILPQYTSPPGVAIYAVYPTKDFMPAKLRVFLDYFSKIYAPIPYWDEGLDIAAATAMAN